MAKLRPLPFPLAEKTEEEPYGTYSTTGLGDVANGEFFDYDNKFNGQAPVLVFTGTKTKPIKNKK